MPGGDLRTRDSRASQVSNVEILPLFSLSSSFDDLTFSLPPQPTVTAPCKGGMWVWPLSNSALSPPWEVGRVRRCASSFQCRQLVAGLTDGLGGAVPLISGEIFGTHTLTEVFLLSTHFLNLS